MKMTAILMKLQLKTQKNKTFTIIILTSFQKKKKIN